MMNLDNSPPLGDTLLIGVGFITAVLLDLICRKRRHWSDLFDRIVAEENANRCFSLLLVGTVGVILLLAALLHRNAFVAGSYALLSGFVTFMLLDLSRSGES